MAGAAQKQLIWTSLIPWQARVLTVFLLVIAALASGFAVGINYESNRRDAQALRAVRNSENHILQAVVNGQTHASNVIKSRQEALEFYRRWIERLKNAKDEQLAQCQLPQRTEPAAAHAVRLNAVWVGLYNAAWLPDSATHDDPGRVADEVVETDFITPRAVLDNVSENARLCAEDRKRLDELIDHLAEVEQMQ